MIIIALALAPLKEVPQQLDWPEPGEQTKEPSGKAEMGSARDEWLHRWIDGWTMIYGYEPGAVCAACSALLAVLHCRRLHSETRTESGVRVREPARRQDTFPPNAARL